MTVGGRGEEATWANKPTNIRTKEVGEKHHTTPIEREISPDQISGIQSKRGMGKQDPHLTDPKAVSKVLNENRKIKLFPTAQQGQGKSGEAAQPYWSTILFTI